MVVAQLVQQSLPLSEVHSSNPVIGKIYIVHLFTVTCIEKTKIKNKEAGNGPFKKSLNYNLQTEQFGEVPTFR